jgi:5-methylcytosine-specific restriction endonuclease McrA
VEKTRSEFHANKNQPDGICHACKPCRKVQKAESHQRNREKQLKKFAAWRAANPDKVKANNERSYRENREKIRAQQNAKRRSSPQLVREYYDRYYAKHQAHHQAKSKAWRAANPERAAESMRRGRIKWEAANPHKVRNVKERRRLRLKGIQVVEFSHDDLLSRLSVFGHACAYCGGPFDALDHVKPIALGGLHILSNIRPACRACNSKKGAKSPRKWFAEVAQRKRA